MAATSSLHLILRNFTRNESIFTESQLDKISTAVPVDTSGADGFAIAFLWSALFYPMVVAGAAGNLLVIWIIATKPMMRTVMNRYLLNLTISDFLSITLNALFNFYFMFNQHWPFGRWYCIVNNFIANLTIASSVCTIMLISLDRYYAIVHPLRPRQSYRRLLLSITIIWAFSACISLPPLFYSDTVEVLPPALSSVQLSSSHSPFTSRISKYTSDGIDSQATPFDALNGETNKNETTTFRSSKGVEEHFNSDAFSNFSSISSDVQLLLAMISAKNNLNTRTLCLMRWPDGDAGFSRIEFLYNLAFTFFLYLVPLITMVVALILMSRVLWPREGMISEHTSPPQQHALIRSKRKVVCMLTCVITVFAVCWAPYHGYFIATYLFPSIIQARGTKHVYLAFYWFAMANSLFNPIILFAMNRRIRNYVMYYLKFTCCPFGLYKIFSRDARRLERRCSSIQVMMRKDNYRAKNGHHHHHHYNGQNQHLSQHRPMPLYYRAQSTMGGAENLNHSCMAPETRRHCCSVNDIPDKSTHRSVMSPDVNRVVIAKNYNSNTSESDRNSESGNSYSGWTLTGPWSRKTPLNQHQNLSNSKTNNGSEPYCTGSGSVPTSSCARCCNLGLKTQRARWQIICSCGRAEFSKPEFSDPAPISGTPNPHRENSPIDGVFLNRSSALPVIKTSSRSLFQLFHWNTTPATTFVRDSNNNNMSLPNNNNNPEEPNETHNCIKLNVTDVAIQYSCLHTPTNTGKSLHVPEITGKYLSGSRSVPNSTVGCNNIDNDYSTASVTATINDNTAL